MRWLKKDPLANIAIRYKLPLSFIFLFLIVFGIGGYIIINSIYHMLDQEILSRVESELITRTILLDKKIETLCRRSEDFSSDGFIRTHTEYLIKTADKKSDSYRHDREKLKIHLQLNKLPLVDEFIDLQIYDLESKELLSVRTAHHPLLNYIRPALRSNRQVCSSIIPANPVDAFPSMAIVTPLWNLQRTKKIAYLVSHVHLLKLWTSVLSQNKTIFANEEASEQFLILADSNNSNLKLSFDFRWEANSSELADTYQIYVDYNFYHHNGKHLCTNNRHRFGKSMTLPGSGWNVLVEYDAASAMQPIRILEGKLLGVALVISLSALLLLFFPIQFVVRPLGQLQKMALRIKEGDFSARVKINSEDEIGSLARSFNTMAEAVEQRTARLQKSATELSIRERELRIQHDRLNKVVEAMSDGLILLDSQENIVLLNNAATALADVLLRNHDQIRIRKCSNGFPVSENCSECLRHNSKPTNCVLKIKGTIFEVISSELPEVESVNGKILLARDITERERMNEMQAHQDRLRVLGKMAAVVAHEMNSPLAAIFMYNQMMEMELPANSAFQEHVEVIKRNSQTCQKIIRDLLDYARIPQPKLEEVDVSSIILDVIRFLRPVYEKKQIQIECKFEAARSVVIGDATQIQQVFVNLIMNSIQALPVSEGFVRIICFDNSETKSLFVDVIDNGVGIEEKHKKEIFEPFFTTKNTSGTGLGLSTAKQIAKAHGGELYLVESRPGYTDFKVELPFSVRT